MLQRIRLFLRYALAWIIIIGCVSLIGFVLYPLLVGKYDSMSLRNEQSYTGGFTVKRWYPLEIERTKITSGEIQVHIPTKGKAQVDAMVDDVSQKVGAQSTSFFSTLKDAFSTNIHKKTVIYTKDPATGTYQGK